MFYDTDKDGVKESILSYYKNKAADKIISTSTNGCIWSWAKKEHDYPIDKDNLKKHSFIVDRNCDGEFDDIYHYDQSIDDVPPRCLKGKYLPPSLDGFTFVQKWDDDWNENGTLDSLIKQFKNFRRDIVTVFYKRNTNTIWAWSLDTYGDKDSELNANYAIVDTNGDGKFNKRYNLGEDVKAPMWVEN